MSLLTSYVKGTSFLRLSGIPHVSVLLSSYICGSRQSQPFLWNSNDHHLTIKISFGFSLCNYLLIVLLFLNFTQIYIITCTNQSTLNLFAHRSPSPEFEARRYIYIVISVIGFTVNDLFYIAAIINYALQCQLITFLVNVTVERMCRNCWKVDHAIKVHISYLVYILEVVLCKNIC